MSTSTHDVPGAKAAQIPETARSDRIVVGDDLHRGVRIVALEQVDHAQERPANAIGLGLDELLEFVEFGRNCSRWPMSTRYPKRPVT